MEQISAEEKNKQDALTLAGKIYETLLEYDRIAPAEDNTPQKRYELCYEKYKSMFDTFPAVMSKMTMELKYSEKAFHRYLDRIQKDMELWRLGGKEHESGETMKKFAENQALYHKYLYIQECSDNHKHYNPKIAKKIYEVECAKMMVVVNEIQDKEKKAKSEFEKESKQHDKERQAEFLDFLQTEVSKLRAENPEKFEEMNVDTGKLSNEIKETFNKGNADEEKQKIDEYKALQKECGELEEQLKKYGIKPKKTPDLNESIRYMKEQLISAKNAEDDDWISGSLIGKYVGNKKRTNNPKAKK